MSTSINTNISAYFAQQNLRSAGESSQASIGRLSSGQRIIRAADDVAGLSVGTVIRTAVNTLKTAYQNAQQASSLLQVADGGLSNITEMLQRQKSLAVQATAGTLSASERGFLNQEFQNLTQEIDRLVQNTKFNQVTLLDGSLTGSRKNQIVQTDNAATGIAAVGGAVASTAVIDFFRNSNEFTGNAAWNAQFVQANLTTQIGNDDYGLLPPSIIGDLGKFEVVSVQYGIAAQLKVTLGGVELTGTFADNTNNFVLSNGTTRVRFTLNAATQIDNQVQVNDFVELMNTNTGANGFGGMKTMGVFQVAGYAPEGTYIDGANAIPLLRLSDTSDMSIKNFQYVGNTGAAGTNILSVEIGGRLFTATAVADDPGVAIQFRNGDDVFRVDLSAIVVTPNIRTDTVARGQFIAGLNQAFTNAQGAITFQTGQTVSDKIDVSIRGVDSKSLFQNQSLSISDVASAQAAGNMIDSAINFVTSVRADVGALQSRFDYASANLQSTIQNQDAARGAFLDADISAESTMFASSQVLLQASISVLAQANQLPQNLLKLIG